MAEQMAGQNHDDAGSPNDAAKPECVALYNERTEVGQSERDYVAEHFTDLIDQLYLNHANPHETTNDEIAGERLALMRPPEESNWHALVHAYDSDSVLNSAIYTRAISLQQGLHGEAYIFGLCDDGVVRILGPDVPSELIHPSFVVKPADVDSDQTAGGLTLHKPDDIPLNLDEWFGDKNHPLSQRGLEVLSAYMKQGGWKVIPLNERPTGLDESEIQ